MTIRQSGSTSARAAERLFRQLETAALRRDAGAEGAARLLEALSPARRRIGEALRAADEQALLLALLPVPGNGRDHDLLGFDPHRDPLIEEVIDDTVAAVAQFVADLYPDAAAGLKS